ncbi:replicative DNA helicase [Niallia endozanthoxylica]|uniref:DNA 5'-3' helicase n=1 Tax=Niallia endozanthoxylica TaxID=2036016 RepID=A0A5J5HR15_9BACI|nr:DnaB-like helicase C-terminal domain-containing protein [Niallia endozanthoxylica]KAA9022024.1 DNA helicase [Niallia endozanthoxylica]
MLAEKALLGTFLKENHLLHDTIIRPEHFAEGRHRLLMQLMKNIHSKSRAVDSITLALEGDPERYGGLSYIQGLLSYANPVKFEGYEDILLEKWKEREKRNILTLAAQEDWEIDRVVSSLQAMNQARVDDYHSISDEIMNVFDDPWRESKKQSGSLTGIKQFDALTNGFQNGDLTIIAARPSMGKTDVMLHLAKQAGWQHYLPVIFSLEMPSRTITMRLIASTGGFNRGKMRDPYQLLSEPQKERWSATLGKLNETCIQQFDGSSQTVPIMRAKLRKVIHEYPERKPIVFIDYLGLITPNDTYGGNANQQVSEISKNLKAMAKDFNCPVVCLAQLNRSVEQRQNKRPNMSDIRDSGSVEQDADVILLLYREKYYDHSLKDPALELIITKNRNGPVGTAYALYNENTGEMKDVDNQRII